MSKRYNLKGRYFPAQGHFRKGLRGQALVDSCKSERAKDSLLMWIERNMDSKKLFAVVNFTAGGGKTQWYDQCTDDEKALGTFYFTHYRATLERVK